MNRLICWYSCLSRKVKMAITVGGIAIAVVGAIAILYMVFKPAMEKETERLNEEQQAQLETEKQRIEEEDTENEGATGLESVEAAMPSDVVDDLHTLDQNLQNMSQDVMAGLEIANEIKELRDSLNMHYEQVAAFPVTPEAEQYKKQYLAAIVKYIQAADAVLQAIKEGDLTCIDQADSLYVEATAIIQELGNNLQSLMPAFE